MQVHALEYATMRCRFFGEDWVTARTTMMGLGKFASTELGLSNGDVVNLATKALLEVDAANAKWIRL